MRNLVYFLGLIVLLLQSCEKQKTDQITENYFYYSFNYEKIPLYLTKSEVFIGFNHSLTKEQIYNYLNEFDFFEKNSNQIIPEGAFLRWALNPQDTIHFKDILRILNNDTISFAVPVFFLNKNDPSSYSIPINEILCKPLISDSELIDLISKKDLEISNKGSSFYLLKFRHMSSGFEPLEIANSLYETGKFYYCHPNMLVEMFFWK